MGFNPKTSASEHGIFFVPKENLAKCFDDIAIATIYEDYTDNWYDALDMDDNFNTYFFETPEKNGDMYITVETYSDNIVPLSCTESEEAEAPLVMIVVYKANAGGDEKFRRVAAQRYEDMQHVPIPIKNFQYSAGDIFAIDVKYTWNGSPHKDYTVKVHSKMDIRITDNLDRENQLHTDG